MTTDAYIANAPNWRKIPGSTTVPGGGDPPDDGVWTTTKILAACSDANGANYWARIQSLDADLAAADSETVPFLAGHHTYSGPAFPATFAASSASLNPGYGWNYSLLNVKCNWDNLRDGVEDAHITSFINSIPAGHKVYLVMNHEPENDPPGGFTSTPESWCRGQARAANLIASINDPRCEFGICLMTWTWDPRSPFNPDDWNAAQYMNTAGLARTIFAPDGYNTITHASPTVIDDPGVQFDDCFDTGLQWGFTRLAVSEHTLNKNISVPVADRVTWWNTILKPYMRAKNLEYYALYDAPGSASGTDPHLQNTPEEIKMFADFCLEYKYV